METCNRCHPLAEMDAGKIAPRIGRIGIYSFTAGIWNQSHYMFRAFETHGWRPPQLTREEMAQVFYFSQVIADPSPQGNAAAGERFVARNRCLSCHIVGSQGAPGGVSWDRLASAKHPGVLVSAIWTHRRMMTRTLVERGLPLPKFEPGDLANLMAFMREAGTPRSATPLLMGLQDIRFDERQFGAFKCTNCHNLRDFVGHPDRTLHQDTEALASHAFMPRFQQPPYAGLTIDAPESLSLASLVYYYGHLDLPGDPKEGRRLFVQHNCVRCHDFPDRPDMRSTKTLIGPVSDEWDFIARIFNKVPLMIQKARVEAKAFPRLTPAEIRHLFAYICAASDNCHPVLEARR
jgi:cytochrome c2